MPGLKLNLERDAAFDLPEAPEDAVWLHAAERQPENRLPAANLNHGMLYAVLRRGSMDNYANVTLPDYLVFDESQSDHARFNDATRENFTLGNITLPAWAKFEDGER
ncbi:unnamed protein product, partial [Mesorhabditis spiculigera]